MPLVVSQPLLDWCCPLEFSGAQPFSCCLIRPNLVLWMAFCNPAIVLYSGASIGQQERSPWYFGTLVIWYFGTLVLWCKYWRGARGNLVMSHLLPPPALLFVWALTLSLVILFSALIKRGRPVEWVGDQLNWWQSCLPLLL